jgi:serine/threonine-protein kinase
MAQVWRAFDTRLDRYVAIKFLSPQYATDATYLERFHREAKAISRLDHSNILTIYDYGEQDGWTYMVSPYIGGGTLTARLRRGPWSVSEALTILEPLASALDYAHAEGLVHRDVKPSNVLFTERDRLVLTDFGIARMVESSTLLSQAGLIVGTPMYMSPEQAEGHPAGPVSDLYSLGVVAYEMLTGRPPFVGETPLALLRAHVDKPLPPPRSLNPAVTDMVEAVLLKILAKDPDDRYASGAQLISALRTTMSTADAGPTLVASPGGEPVDGAGRVNLEREPPPVSPDAVTARQDTSAPTAATQAATAATRVVGAQEPLKPMRRPPLGAQDGARAAAPTAILGSDTLGRRRRASTVPKLVAGGQSS